MKKYFFLFFALALPLFATGQGCSCEKKFQFIRHEMETNYAGFKDKVNPKTRKAYDKVTRECLAKVKKAKNAAYCLAALYKWTEFFKDGHVQLYDPHEPDMKDTAAINERIKKTEIIKLSPEKLKQLAHSKDHEEGIYYFFDSSYKIAIVKNKNDFRDYAGVIISSKYDVWKPGQVKLEMKKLNDSLYDAILYMRDHSYRLQLYYFNGRSFDGGNWNKIGKQETADKTDAHDVHFERIQTRKLSDSTFYVQIGTFSIRNAKAIDSVFKANEAILKRTPNLIIDVRRNGGGGDASYQPILPWLYTNPLIGIGNEVYATPDNIRRWQKNLNDPDLPENVKTEIKNMINAMQQHIGKFVSNADNDTMSLEKVEPYPKKVVILTEHHCASSTEEFLLAAKQSSKVTIMGEHTYGELDYSNWLVAESPCKDIEFHYSSTRSRRIGLGKGIDGVGIKPDIVLSDKQDWIEEARKYMEK